MQHGQVVQPGGGIAQALIPLAVIAVIFAFRIRRASRAPARPLKPGQLWVVPALYLLMVAATFAARPPTPVGWLAAALGLALGGLVGWYRGRTVAIHVDPATGTLRQKASPVGVLILLALVLAKSAAQAGGRATHLDVGVLTDALLAMALGTFAAMRAEMFLRARRVLRAHMAGVFS